MLGTDALSQGGYGEYTLYGALQKPAKVNEMTHKPTLMQWKRERLTAESAPPAPPTPTDMDEPQTYSFGYGDGYAQVVEAHSEDDASHAAAPPPAKPVRLAKVEMLRPSTPEGALFDDTGSNASFSMGYGDGYAVYSVDGESSAGLTEPELMPYNEALVA